MKIRSLIHVSLLTILGLKLFFSYSLQKAGEQCGDITNPDATIPACTTLIEHNYQNAGAWNNRGVAYRKKELYDLALQDFDHAPRINPNYANALADSDKALYKKQSKP